MSVVCVYTLSFLCIVILLSAPSMYLLLFNVHPRNCTCMCVCVCVCMCVYVCVCVCVCMCVCVMFIRSVVAQINMPNSLPRSLLPHRFITPLERNIFWSSRGQWILNRSLEVGTVYRLLCQCDGVSNCVLGRGWRENGREEGRGVRKRRGMEEGERGGGRGEGWRKGRGVEEGERGGGRGEGWRKGRGVEEGERGGERGEKGEECRNGRGMEERERVEEEGEGMSHWYSFNSNQLLLVCFVLFFELAAAGLLGKREKGIPFTHTHTHTCTSTQLLSTYFSL